MIDFEALRWKVGAWWRRTIWPVGHITLGSSSGLPGGHPGQETLDVLPRRGARRLFLLGAGSGVTLTMLCLELLRLLMGR